MMNVRVVNESTCVADKDVRDALDAIYYQIREDASSFWPLPDRAFVLTTSRPPNPTFLEYDAQLIILDDPDQAGALGYHELTKDGQPLGKVFAKLDIAAGTSWTVTLSHEILEMLVDPWCNLMAMGRDGRIRALEICDPVESDDQGYLRNGVRVSNFVTPRWFIGGAPGPRQGEPGGSDAGAGDLDIRRSLKQSFQVAPGGYIAVFDPGSEKWIQNTAGITSEDVLKGDFGTETPPTGSRRWRRAQPFSYWRRSTR